MTRVTTAQAREEDKTTELRFTIATKGETVLTLTPAVCRRQFLARVYA